MPLRGEALVGVMIIITLLIEKREMGNIWTDLRCSLSLWEYRSSSGGIRSTGNGN
jgi:hypothetical protein